MPRAAAHGLREVDGEFKVVVWGPVRPRWTEGECEVSESGLGHGQRASQATGASSKYSRVEPSALTALCKVCLAGLQRADGGGQAGRYQVRGGIESHHVWPD